MIELRLRLEWLAEAADQISRGAGHLEHLRKYSRHRIPTAEHYAAANSDSPPEGWPMALALSKVWKERFQKRWLDAVTALRDFPKEAVDDSSVPILDRWSVRLNKVLLILRDAFHTNTGIQYVYHLDNDWDVAYRGLFAFLTDLEAMVVAIPGQGNAGNSRLVAKTRRGGRKKVLGELEQLIREAAPNLRLNSETAQAIASAYNQKWANKGGRTAVDESKVMAHAREMRRPPRKDRNAKKAKGSQQ